MLTFHTSVRNTLPEAASAHWTQEGRQRTDDRQDRQTDCPIDPGRGGLFAPRGRALPHYAPGGYKTHG